jgi:hypothetical protein
MHIAMEIAFHEDDWDDYGVDGENLASCIFWGHNFVVNSEGNDEGVDFYILMCTKTLFAFTTSFKCPWRQGDMALVEKYYQKWG